MNSQDFNNDELLDNEIVRKTSKRFIELHDFLKFKFNSNVINLSFIQNQQGFSGFIGFEAFGDGKEHTDV